MKRLAIGLTLVFLPACYSSVRDARTDQTRAAAGWTCYANPASITCPDQPGQTCTAWNQRWQATCPDDGSRWVCQFVGDSGSTQCRRYGD